MNEIDDLKRDLERTTSIAETAIKEEATAFKRGWNAALEEVAKDYDDWAKARADHARANPLETNHYMYLSAQYAATAEYVRGLKKILIGRSAVEESDHSVRRAAPRSTP